MLTYLKNIFILCSFLLLISCASSDTAHYQIFGEVNACPIMQSHQAQLSCLSVEDPTTLQYKSYVLGAADPAVQKFVQSINDQLKESDEGLPRTNAETTADKQWNYSSVADADSSLQVPISKNILQNAINNSFMDYALSNLAYLKKKDIKHPIKTDGGICQFPENLMERVLAGNKLIKFPGGISYIFQRFWVTPSHTSGKQEFAQAIQRLQALPFGPMAVALNANTPLPSDASAAVMYHDIYAPSDQMLILFEKSGCTTEIAVLNPTGLYTTGPGVFLTLPSEFLLPLSR